jgi:hypothetical protein
VPTPTTILQAQTHQWLGAFCGPGNGDSRQELMRAAQVLTAYAAGILFPTEGEIRRLDGLSGNAAPLRERLAWKLGWITHGRMTTCSICPRSKPDSKRLQMPSSPIPKAA